MRYCDEYAALLDLFVDGELSPAKMADVQAHLDACPGCRAYVDDVLAIRAAFPCWEDAEVPDGFADGVMAAVQPQAAPKPRATRKQPRTARKRRNLSKLLLPLAACCAIVLLVRGVGLGGGSKFEYATTTADTAAPMEAEAFAEEPASDEADIACGNADAAPEMAYTSGAQKNGIDDLARSSPYFAILTLPADALETELLADGAPVSEADGERRYELSSGDYAALLDQLDAAGIQPVAREQTGAESDTALVIVTGL